MKSITIMLKLTLACNLHCSYCYHSNMRTAEKMNLDIFEKVLIKCQKYDEIKMVWHGGEPLLMGLDFFKKIIKLQKNSGLNIINNIQTNLTLLNDDWIQFFLDNKFSIGTSLDGVKEIHDFTRNNSFDKVIIAIKKIQEKNIPIAAIATITLESLPYLYENFQLFKNLNINMTFNCEISNKNSKVYEFAIRFYYDLYLGSNKSIRFEPIQKISKFFDDEFCHGCLYGDNCIGTANAILANGDVYFCGRLANNYGYLGNVYEKDFSFGFDNLLVKKYHNENEIRIQKCSNCEYFKMCRNGCFNNRDVNGIDSFCEAYKGIFKHILIRKNQLGI